MSDSADCFTATVVRPDGLCLRDRLVADMEPSHQSVYSAETVTDALAIDVFGRPIRRRTGLGRIYGQDAHQSFESPTSDARIDRLRRPKIAGPVHHLLNSCTNAPFGIRSVNLDIAAPNRPVAAENRVVQAQASGMGPTPAQSCDCLE